MNRYVIIISCIFLFNGCAAYKPEPDRPAMWAQSINIDGVPNLHRVTDSLYRSAQPTAQGMKNLKGMGIKTVVSLRSFNSDRDEIGTTELGYERISMKAWRPEHNEAIRFLQIASNPERCPILVHCKKGADRTGTMIAIYRIAVQDWTKEEAIREMVEGGYGFHRIWNNLTESNPPLVTKLSYARPYTSVTSVDLSQCNS